MVSESERAILHEVTRGNAAWGRSHSRPHAAAQALLIQSLVQVIDFPDGSFVAFPPHMNWDYRNNKPVVPRLQLVSADKEQPT